MDNPKTHKGNLFSPAVGYRMKHHDVGYKFIPKTASTSIKFLLFEIEKERPFMPSSKSLEYDITIHRWVIEKRLGDISDCQSRLLVIRDPIERFISAFNEKTIQKGFFRDNQIEIENSNLSPGFPTPDINFFIVNLEVFWEFKYIYLHMRPLTEILGELDLSFFTHVFPIENIDELYISIQQLTGTQVKLPHRNNSKVERRQVTLADISEKNYNFLRQFFECDYELLNDYYHPEKQKKNEQNF